MACDSPFYVKIHWQPDDVPVPCGKCPPCQQRRVAQWAFRLRKHEEICDSAIFLTLTYNTQHVPITEKGFMTLSKRDVQLFFKRLRKSLPKNHAKITYYLCGEYGSSTFRPHYHAIVFNCSLDQCDFAWQLGDVHAGDVTGASIAYTLKYINKGKMIPVHQNDDRVPEFSLMSKGIGKNYLTPQIVKYHKDDLARAFVTTADGFRVALPRFYKNKIYNEHEQKQQAFICKRLSEEVDRSARRQFEDTDGSPYGFDEQIESGRRSRYNRHRKQGLDTRKKL